MKKLSLFALSCLLLTASCKKPNESTKTNTFGLLNGTMPIGSMPTVENGMLSFKDVAQFDDFQQRLLDAAITMTTTPDANGNTPTLDEALGQLEQGISNFTSFRSLNVEKFEMGNINGWDKESDIPEKHKLGDPILESILNQYGAVIIGEQIAFHVNRDLILTFSKAEMNNIYSVLIEMPENVRQNSSSISRWISNIDISKIKAIHISDEGDISLGDPIPLGNYFGFTAANAQPRIVLKNPCDPKTFTLKEFFVGKIGDWNAVVSANFTINWGDGTSTTDVAPAGASVELDHTYSSAGNYHPVLTVHCSHQSLNETISTGFTTVAVANNMNACTSKTDKEKNVKKYSADGKAYINCRIIFRSKLLANNIQSETEYYEKNSNGKWKNVKTGSGRAINTRVYGYVGQGNCSNMNFEDQSDPSTNKKSAFAVKRWGMFTQSGDQIVMEELNSNHYAFYGNEKIELNLKLSKCD